MSTPVSAQIVEPREPARVRWLPRRVQSENAFRRLAAASVVGNVLLVVTGGAVRLTDSGLGCPTWPSCTDSSLTPTKQYAIHGIIEFSNRGLGVLLGIVAVSTWLVAIVLRRERLLATVAALGIPVQAVVGGITVRTHLNPWVVSLHFLLSMPIIAVAFALWWRLRAEAVRQPVPSMARLFARVTVGVAAVVLVVGTVVTGAGPHAGDTDTSGNIHRNGLNVESMSQLHADIVMLLVGLTLGLVAIAHLVRGADALRNAAIAMLGIELVQGVIGYTQYFLDVPPLLVAAHMFGACLVWLAALRVYAATLETADVAA